MHNKIKQVQLLSFVENPPKKCLGTKNMTTAIQQQQQKMANKI